MPARVKLQLREVGVQNGNKKDPSATDSRHNYRLFNKRMSGVAKALCEQSELI